MQYKKGEEKKYSLSYEDYEDNGLTQKDLVQKVLNDEELKNLKSIIIGCYGEAWDEGPDDLLDAFIENKEKLSHIEAFFIGDMDSEECEVSWIIQGNYEKFFQEFPDIKKMTIKGGSELSLGIHKFLNLEHLEIVSGGLPLSVINEIVNSEFPKLETLILYLGVDDYGFDGGIEDLSKLVSKEKFPALKHLGLVNSELQDEITHMVLQSDILPQLDKLSLFYGTISDAAGEELINHADKISHLSEVDCTYNFFSDEMIKKLEELPVNIDLSDQQENDERYGNYPMITE